MAVRCDCGFGGDQGHSGKERSIITEDTGDGLLVPHERFPSIRERKVTLIRIEGDNIRFANTIERKRRLLSHSPDSATYLAVWMGQYDSRVYSVPTDLRGSLGR